MKENEIPFTKTDLISGVFDGTLESILGDHKKGDSVLCPDLERQLPKILYNERRWINNMFLIDPFYFDIQGAFPYSREVDAILWGFSEMGMLSHIIGKEGTVIHHGIVVYGRDALKRKLISYEKYQKIKDLGRKIEAKSMVSV